MKLLVATILVIAAWGTLAVSSEDQTKDQSESGKCERLVPLPPGQESYRLTCVYRCKDDPSRFENEPDGIPCGHAPVIREIAVCKNGTCVLSRPVPCPPDETEGTTTSASVTTQQSNSTQTQ
ncbi:uncharacterized protein LOC119443972 isoform X2 [Dermacentor silvarum]|uniref:uncharacterized protein LOC119443972 isoform X1 n=1 Tax=Dermacentor silvarum TaxID=543639 RepID=UPI00189849AC|nr:uncharacterized protein LOC119443972 isoform X1 [Dermacentor silvarum]XP_049519489.1 uncharacterized protein LOC119443972 isoform X2 [Dermacentor silvarum]